MGVRRQLRVSRRSFLVGSAGVLGTLVACGDERLVVGADALDGDDDGHGALDGSDAGDGEVGSDAVGVDSDDGSDAVGDGASLDTAEAPDTSPPPRFDPEAYLEASDSLYPIAVWAADPGADRVTLGTRYTGGDALELVVWRPDGEGADGVLVLRRAITPAEAGFVAELVEGLAASSEHRYVFVAAERRSPVGRFRTAPGAGERPIVTLGATSCARWELRPFEVLARAAEDDLDAFLLLGDTTYADDAKTLGEYRDNWGRNLASSEYRALRLSTAIAATWDDHEVDNNWDPESVDPTRLAAARRAFFEHVTPRPTAPDRIWRSLRFGQTVEVFMLDLRSERRPSTREEEDAELISPAQFDWLVQGVASSTATFKLIANPVPITNWPPLFVGADQRWEGYAAQRDKVLAAVSKVPGVLWVAGDFHFAAIARVEPPGEPYFAQTEMLVGPVAHVNPGLAVVELTGDEAQFPFLSGNRNYGRLIFDPTTSPPTATLEHIGPGGTVLNRQVVEA